MRYVYTVWFRDVSAAVDDQDREWPACFVVEADQGESARQWGDHLARNYALSRGCDFISSEAELTDRSDLPGIEKLPLVQYGAEASDDEIGW